MKIAVDRNSLSAIKNNYAEYVYLFDDESLDELIKTNLHCLYYKYCDYVDINLTKYDVDCLKKASIEDKDFDKLPEKRDFKFAFIVPNFNYADCLEKCLESICNQTYKNFEIVFVDDVSTDDSVQIARKIASKYFPSIVINVIELKQKRLNGGARNEAYLHVSDDVDYIYYVDSDDWLYSDDVLEKINNKLQSYPDVLFVGLADFKKGKTTPCIIPRYKTKYEAIKGWSGSCGKVIKKSLATRQECLYNEGTLKEDRNQHCRICCYMQSFKCLSEPVYVWNRENYKSVTTIRDKVLWGTSTIRHYADTLQLYLSVKGQDKTIDNYLEERVNKTKTEMLEGGDKQW